MIYGLLFLLIHNIYMLSACFMMCDNPLWSTEESCESAIIVQHQAQLSHTS